MEKSLHSKVAGRIALLLFTGICVLASAPAWAGRAAKAPQAALSTVEAEMLSFMREEEKLARDVYLAMYDEWETVNFSNIAGSEQRHMDTLKKMLDKYGLADPASAETGVFNNQSLQAKYMELVDIGLQSYADGLYVGATIEELDMVDIQHALDETTHLDLATAYQNLLEGSKNHLRAYVASMAALGIVYQPQFLSRELYDAIIGM